MYLKTSLLAVAMFACATTVACATPSTSGALAVPANRIAGLWNAQAAIGPCGSGVTPIAVNNTLLFHPGGTVSEGAKFPPGGAPNVFGVAGLNQRNDGLGTWSFDPATEVYAFHLRFDWYVDGAYHGYQTVDREIMLSSDGQQAFGPVHTVRYAANGSAIAELCGSAVQQRL